MNKRGFTLIELVVATFITGIAVMLAMGILQLSWGRQLDVRKSSDYLQNRTLISAHVHKLLIDPQKLDCPAIADSLRMHIPSIDSLELDCKPLGEHRSISWKVQFNNKVHIVVLRGIALE